MPVNWYAALVVIVLVGIGSVVLARYNYGKNTVVQPTVNTTWHAALSVDICGSVESSLPTSNPTSTNGFVSAGGGVLTIAPKTSAQAGRNATLAQFASNYTGMTLTNKSLQFPSGTLYKNGAKCAKGTPDAGKAGVVRARTFTLTSKGAGKNESKLVGGSYTDAAGSIRFANGQLIVVGFVPSGAKLPKPAPTVELALVQALQSGGSVVTTTTTLPTASTTTTAPTSSTTTSTTSSASTTTSTTSRATTTTTTTKHATTTTTHPVATTTTTSPTEAPVTTTTTEPPTTTTTTTTP